MEFIRINTEYLVELRVASGYSKAEIGRRMGKNKADVYAYIESGKRLPTMGNLGKLKAVFPDLDYNKLFVFKDTEGQAITA